MNVQLLVITVLVCFDLFGGCPPEVEWERTYTSGVQNGSLVQQTEDGGFIATGRLQIIDDYDVYLIRTDADGNVLPGWPKTYGGEDDDYGHFVRQTQDGGFIVTGGTRSFGAGGPDVYLIRTDADGSVLPGWPKTYGGVRGDCSHSVQQTPDGGFIVTGGTRSFGAGGSDVYLIRTGANGNVQPGWPKTYGDSDYDHAYSVQQTEDGGFIVAGSTRSFGAGSEDVYLIRTDADGNVLPDWPKTYGGANRDEGYSVQQTQDGGFLVSGNTISFGSGPYMIRMDDQGNELWSLVPVTGCQIRGESIFQTSDGGYMIVGTTNQHDIFAMKLDSDREEEWSKIFEKEGDQFAESARQTTDGGYIISGHNMGEFYLLRLASDSLIAPFKRGDVNTDTRLDISDAVTTLGHLFTNRQIDCKKAADTNDDGNLDIADAIYLLAYLFIEGLPPPQPFEECGDDPTEDCLSCISFPPCEE